MQVFGEPGRLLRQMHEAVLDHRGLRVHPHDFVRLRLVAGDRVQASCTSSWIAWVPDALSSIKTNFHAELWPNNATRLSQNRLALAGKESVSVGHRRRAARPTAQEAGARLATLNNDLIA